MPDRALILASGSRYRREQLARVGIAVECIAPDIDESRLPGERPAQMALRLAGAKAAAVAAMRGAAVIIAADQVAALGERILHKPGSAAAQAEQLRSSAGHEVRFHTAVVVRGPGGEQLEHLDLTCCWLRPLSDEAISRYVALEPAYDCAGGFKIEGRGIVLFERIESSDPSALIGLPLIGLLRMLRQFAWELP